MILCCGEALIDMIETGNGEDGTSFAPLCGGSVFNTAIALGRLECTPGFLSGISTDRFGRQLESELTKSGVRTDHLIRSDRPTTLAFVETVQGEASYTFYDEGSAGRMLCMDDLPELPPAITTVMLGGISLIPEPCGSAYESLADQRATGRVVYVDPNIRAPFIPDAAAHRARIERMIANATIVKVSNDDLAWLADGADPYDTIQRWLAAGVALVLLTQGAGVVKAIRRKSTIQLSPPTIAVGDTVGAGDTLSAGFLAKLSDLNLLSPPAIADARDEDIRAALDLACWCAAVTASRQGANPPWRRDMEREEME